MIKRRVLPFVIALCLVFSCIWAVARQDAASTASSPAQTPSSTTAEGQKPADNGHASEKKAQDGQAGSDAKAPVKSREGNSALGGNAARHKAAVSNPDDGPRKIVVRHGGASEPTAQIAPGMTPAEAARQRQNTERLLEATGDQLQLLSTRSLDAARQETVGQIRNFMTGARAALQEGDLRRANTLAEKAHSVVR